MKGGIVKRVQRLNLIKGGSDPIPDPVLVYKVMDNVTSKGKIEKDYPSHGGIDFSTMAMIAHIDASAMGDRTNGLAFFAFGYYPWRWGSHTAHFTTGNPYPLIGGAIINGGDAITGENNCGSLANVEIIFNPRHGLYINGKKILYPNDPRDTEGVWADFAKCMSDEAEGGVIWHGFGGEYGYTTGVKYDVGYYIVDERMYK